MSERVDPYLLAKYGIISRPARNAYPYFTMSRRELRDCDRHQLQANACLVTGIYRPIGKAKSELDKWLAPTRRRRRRHHR
ncbi:MAG: hypothetical protein K2X77_33650 [Candidatus Obscuribacterales bacterium]|nr:hypothetical protein [Candidatus Obscuribacterales bacterium]